MSEERINLELLGARSDADRRGKRPATPLHGNGEPFSALESRFTAMEARLSGIEGRLGVLEDRMSSMMSLIVRIAERLDGGSQ